MWRKQKAGVNNSDKMTTMASEGIVRVEMFGIWEGEERR